jgi:hypothetical protein
MKSIRLSKTSVFRLALGGAIALFTQSMFSQSWQTVDSFQYIAGDNAWNRGLVAAPSGTVYAYGAGSTSTNLHVLVMASGDDGTTWSAPLDDLSGVAFAPAWDGQTLACDAHGTLYYITQAHGGSSYPTQWLVRQGTGGGTTWATVDDYTFVGSDSAASLLDGVCADAWGNVYVAGTVGYNSSGYYWTVRKGVGGTSYSTVDSYSPYGYGSAHAVFAHPTAGVFVVGRANFPSVIVHKRPTLGTGWTVRRSQDGGATWSNVDQLANCAAYGIGTDANGYLYVVGQFAFPNIGACWLVRKSTDGGNSWTTVDTFQLAAGYAAQAQCFVADSLGNLFVAGIANTSSGGQEWIVRENPGGNSAWSVVDSVPNGTPKAICADASGHVFVGGNGGGIWTVRRN